MLHHLADYAVSQYREMEEPERETALTSFLQSTGIPLWVRRRALLKLLLDLPVENAAHLSTATYYSRADFYLEEWICSNGFRRVEEVREAFARVGRCPLIPWDAACLYNVKEDLDDYTTQYLAALQNRPQSHDAGVCLAIAESLCADEQEILYQVACANVLRPRAFCPSTDEEAVLAESLCGKNVLRRERDVYYSVLPKGSLLLLREDILRLPTGGLMRELGLPLRKTILEDSEQGRRLLQVELLPFVCRSFGGCEGAGELRSWSNCKSQEDLLVLEILQDFLPRCGSVSSKAEALRLAQRGMEEISRCSAFSELAVRAIGNSVRIMKDQLSLADMRGMRRLCLPKRR